MHLCNGCELESSATPHRCSLRPGIADQTQQHLQSRKPALCSPLVLGAGRGLMYHMFCMVTQPVRGETQRVPAHAKLDNPAGMHHKD